MNPQTAEQRGPNHWRSAIGGTRATGCGVHRPGAAARVTTSQTWTVLFAGWLLVSAATTWAGELRFRPHQINGSSSCSAGAAFDVDHDGDIDVVSGGWWYEAPHWKRHFIREVPVIRGRCDDYSNLPLDVNGDGWLDLINANYRSSGLYWIEHPGPGLGPWKTHVIAKPGPMETGRLADVNSDGQLDVLPNGTKFAAWWELKRVGAAFRWVRHDLPSQLAGHGIGCGDIDGDGLNDLVGPRGWARAVDAQNDRWQWLPEFQLHRDSSVPILVFDVDQDGDTDVVWSRAHHAGIYWLEQQRINGRRRWRFHVIDTSCSQLHALELADLDGDGRPEVVAGKRYMAHGGKDVGEYDPLAVIAYSYNPQSKTWHRTVLHVGGRIGFGTAPYVADLDQDGDLDLVCPELCGLYWLENLQFGQDRAARFGPTSFPPASYPDHTNLLVFRDTSGRLRPVRTPREWGIRRMHILANMQLVMGSLPDPSRRVPTDVQVLSEQQTLRYIRRKIRFRVEPGDWVPAWLLIPNDRSGPAPAMLCLHPTSRLAKDEVAGLDGRATRQYGHELACRGYVCLVPDYPSFGEYDYDFRAARHRYASGSMKAVWNNVRALDVLESLPEVDRDRIGVIGHSLGAHNALFTAAFDLRIRAVISSCGFTAFHCYNGGDLSGWASDRYMPLIRSRYSCDPDKMPFDFYEVVAAIAPRALFVNAPLRDANFDVNGVRQVLEQVRKVYSLFEQPEKLEVVYPDSTHDFPDAVRQQAYQWLDRVMEHRPRQTTATGQKRRDLEVEHRQTKEAKNR